MGHRRWTIDDALTAVGEQQCCCCCCCCWCFDCLVL